MATNEQRAKRWSARALAGPILIGPLLAQGGPSVCVVPAGEVLSTTATGADRYGQSIAADGTTLAVGAPNFDGPAGNDTGAVFLYEHDGTAWNPDATLFGPRPLDGFGIAVALEGNRLAIGSTFYDEVFVFERTGGVWTQTAVLASSLPPAMEFGRALALDGDHLLVGAPDAPSVVVGAAAVWKLSTTGTWNEDAVFVGADVGPGERFGFGVALQGTTAVVGAKGHGAAGAAYVFEDTGHGLWNEVAKLVPTGATNGAEFGTSVGLDGDLLAVGAFFDSARGSAYLFERSGAAWSQLAKLTASDGAFRDDFGVSLSLRAGSLLVGAPAYQASTPRPGKAYLFEPSRSGGAGWNEVARILPPLNDGALFGAAVDHAGETLFVSAILSSLPGGPLAGSVHAYEPVAPPLAYCTAKVNSCGGTPAIVATGHASASASAGFVISASGARDSKFGLPIYSPSGRANLPFQGGTLCIAPQGLRRGPNAISSGGAPGPVCDQSFSIDWNAFAAGALGGTPQAWLSQPGQQVNVQWWGRDTIQHGSFVSDGLEFRVCP